MDYYLIKRTYRFDDINNNSFVLSGGLASFLRHEGPQLVQVESWFVILILLVMEVALTLLTEVARVTDKNEKLAKKGVLTISRS